MSSEQPQTSVLDARLAEIDQRLRSIQTGLVAEPEPVPAVPVAPAAVTPAAPVAPAGRPPAGPARPDAAEDPEPIVAELRHLGELVAAQSRLIDSLRGLLAQPAQSAPPAVAEGQIAVKAGPFTSTQAVRAFTAAVEALPGVREVEFRGYEAGNRAIIDVHLCIPTS